MTSRIEAALAELKSFVGFQLTDPLLIEREFKIPDRELVPAELQAVRFRSGPIFDC